MISLTINRCLSPRLPDGWFCRGKSSLAIIPTGRSRISPWCEGSERDYIARPATLADTAVVIEVGVSLD